MHFELELAVYILDSAHPFFERSNSAAFIKLMLQMILNAAPRAQSKPQNGAQSESILHALAPAPLSANELIARLKLRSKTGAFKRAMKALLDDGLIEYTLPDKPNSRLQKYHLTGKGQAMPNTDMAQALRDRNGKPL